MFKRKADICMEIKDDVIRYVELKSLDPIIVRQYGEKRLPENLIDGGKIINMAAFKDFIATCVKEWRFKRRKILFIEPDETVALKLVTVPIHITQEEMRGYLYHALGESIILPFEHSAIDYAICSETEQEQTVLLVATPEDLVTNYAQAFRSNQLELIAADISPLCIYRLYLDQMRNGYLPEEIMILQVDTLSTTISILEDHVPIFMQSEKLFTQKKQWKDDLEMATDMQNRLTDLISEIQRILHFYQFSISQGKVIKEIILVGGNPFLDSFGEEMKKRLNVAIKTITETIPTLNGKSVPKQYHLAIGLGLKGVQYHVNRH